MITHLRYEPRCLPANFPARLADDPLKVFAVKIARQRARGIRLIGIALALMPKHRAEALRAQQLHAGHQRGVGFAFALPRAAGKLAHPTSEGRRIRKLRALRQPLAHTRRADAAGHESHWDIAALDDRIAEWRQETTAAAAGTGLRIVGHAPLLSIE
jgi:hypothetical protein